MKAHKNKMKENKARSVANFVFEARGGRESTFEFVDNRPVGIAQRRLQEMANNRASVPQRSVAPTRVASALCSMSKPNPSGRAGIFSPVAIPMPVGTNHEKNRGLSVQLKSTDPSRLHSGYLQSIETKNNTASLIMQLQVSWDTVVKTLGDLLRTHRQDETYKQLWQSGAARRIATEVGARKDTDKSNTRRRLAEHDEIAPLLRPHRMELETKRPPPNPEDIDHESVNAEELRDVYAAFRALLCYHVSKNPGAVMRTGLDPAKGGAEGGLSDERSLKDRREQNLAAAQGKVFVTRKHDEARQYADGHDDRIVMLIVPLELQSNVDNMGPRLDVDPDSAFGLVGTQHLKGTILHSGYPNFWATLYLMKQMGNERAKLKFSSLWGVLLEQKRIHS